MKENQNTMTDKSTKISVELATRLLNEFDADITISNIEQYRNTNHNSIAYLLSDQNNEKYVLKILSETDSSCRKEMFISHYLQEIIPIPEVYYVNESCSIIDMPYQISEFVTGISLREYLTAKQQISDNLITGIAESLALLHRSNYEHAGYLNEQLEPVHGLSTINEWHQVFLAGLAGNRLGTELKNKTFAYINKNKDLLDELSTSFVLSHGNFSIDNIIVLDEKLQAIMDWESALSAPNVFDIGQLFRDASLFPKKTKRLFAEAYNSSSLNPLQSNWQAQAELMDCINLLGLLSLEALSLDLQKKLIAIINKYVLD